MSIEAMKQALDALEHYQSRMSVEKFDSAITTLRAAIEEAEKQEPVAEIMSADDELRVNYVTYPMASFFVEKS